MEPSRVGNRPKICRDPAAQDGGKDRWSRDATLFLQSVIRAGDYQGPEFGLLDHGGATAVVTLGKGHKSLCSALS